MKLTNFVVMKMQKYIRFILSLVLILSNLSVAFSMHFCEGEVEMVKLNHLDNQVCKMKKPTSCCAEKEVEKNCDPSKDEQNEDDCCLDLAYSDELQNQQTVDVFKIQPIHFQDIIFTYPVLVFESLRTSITNDVLDFYVESNAPPIYILHKQLVVYES